MRKAIEVHGRYEPHLLPCLRTRRIRLVRAPWTLVHSRDPALVADVLAGRVLFTRLDGEWWTLPHPGGR